MNDSSVDVSYLVNRQKIIRERISEDKTIEETLETIVIELKEINGDILEIVMDYLNHKVNIILLK